MLSCIISLMADLYLNEDNSRLLAVPPECHQHSKDLEAECLTFVTKLKEFKELSAKITASASDAETSIKNDQARAEEIRQQMSDGDQDRESQVRTTLEERKATLQGLEAKLEELELKETEQALAQLGV